MNLCREFVADSPFSTGHACGEPTALMSPYCYEHLQNHEAAYRIATATTLARLTEEVERLTQSATSYRRPM